MRQILRKRQPSKNADKTAKSDSKVRQVSKTGKSDSKVRQVSQTAKSDSRVVQGELA